MFINKKILIIADFDQNRICGQTVHLNYLKCFFEKYNSVKLQTTAKLRQIIKSDIIWFRSEKGFLKFFLLCLIFKKTMIYDMASFPWLELKINHRSWLRVNISLYLFKIASKVAQIRVLSCAMKRYLLQHFKIPSEKIFVFYIPIEITIKNKRLQTDGKINFAYLGLDRSWQGIANLLKAFKQLETEPEFILHCYGIKKQNTKNIFFHESLSHEQLLQILSRDIDVVVIPRERNEITETVMPMKYAEAIHLNKYILATDLTVLHEIANKKVFFINNNEVSTLIDGIKSFRNIIPKNFS